ncbi:unnamed protein product [Durusdinium trenchii]|uniref:C3H1-type domain-containing protein n=1 Tax=Durusdinium trenchii TaxID=1381693 RepID=A0ABP0MNG2_9DINO
MWFVCGTQSGCFRLISCQRGSQDRKKSQLVSMVATDLSSKLKRTKICKFWVCSRCTLGEACTFAHSTCDLQEQPDLVKTELCFQFMSKGRCKRGADCTFAHGKKELRKPPKEMPKGTAVAAKMSAEAQECLSEMEVKPPVRDDRVSRTW